MPELNISTFAILHPPPIHGLDLVLRREWHGSGDTTGNHLHLDFCALYIVRGGRGAHQIDGVPFGISRGDVYLMPPGSIHAYTNYHSLEIDAFYFPLGLWSDEELGALRELSGFWRLFLERDAQRLHLRPELYTRIEKEIAEMHAEAEREASFGLKVKPLLLRAALFSLLVMLARVQLDEATQNVLSNPGTRLSDLLSWCEAHVGQDISVSTLAARMFLSPAHFARLFKREMGVPPATYLRRLKLERARTLLENQNCSVAQVAQESGFESAAHFSRTFRTCYGISPGQFRRQSGR